MEFVSRWLNSEGVAAAHTQPLTNSTVHRTAISRRTQVSHGRVMSERVRYVMGTCRQTGSAVRSGQVSHGRVMSERVRYVMGTCRQTASRQVKTGQIRGRDTSENMQ